MPPPDRSGARLVRLAPAREEEFALRGKGVGGTRAKSACSSETNRGHPRRKERVLASAAVATTPLRRKRWRLRPHGSPHAPDHVVEAQQTECDGGVNPVETLREVDADGCRIRSIGEGLFEPALRVVDRRAAGDTTGE